MPTCDPTQPTPIIAVGDTVRVSDPTWPDHPYWGVPCKVLRAHGPLFNWPAPLLRLKPDGGRSFRIFADKVTKVEV